MGKCLTSVVHLTELALESLHLDVKHTKASDTQAPSKTKTEQTNNWMESARGLSVLKHVGIELQKNLGNHHSAV